MKSTLFTDMVSLALAQKTGSAKLVYLLKGIAFYFFLAEEPDASKERSSSAAHTDDIYPLF